MPSLPEDAFKRYDETPDEEFYRAPRFVTHIDNGAIAAVTQLYRELFPPGAEILDLMSSWVSHLPPEVEYGRVVGLGMNEDELQEYVGHPVNLLDAADVARALAEVRQIIPVPALVVHTRYWAIATGPDAARHREALASAVRVAATRYRIGDDFTAAEAQATAAMPRHSGGARLVADIEDAVPDAVGVPAFSLDVPHPTSIGLGDSFVGGFLAVHAENGSAS